MQNHLSDNLIIYVKIDLIINVINPWKSSIIEEGLIELNQICNSNKLHEQLVYNNRVVLHEKRIRFMSDFAARIMHILVLRLLPLFRAAAEIRPWK